MYILYLCTGINNPHSLTGSMHFLPRFSSFLLFFLLHIVIIGIFHVCKAYERYTLSIIRFGTFGISHTSFSHQNAEQNEQKQECWKNVKNKFDVYSRIWNVSFIKKVKRTREKPNKFVITTSVLEHTIKHCSFLFWYSRGNSRIDFWFIFEFE